ncbi:EscU/YscU/HrcU family type III secretion system export apparatus switch protein [Burkholderia sp. Ac-20365]|jgi:flagellar biosynthesis protein|uniref:EscU/YscU/HrcU family type III secretion system export apparatus switch protein n=1 Tax=Burkholderia sp. Ac-20365 TaxID=2703897 RepID=UPI00197B795F|nr:EscU/YscU/HrcU family type III secretion system export apparatus switch protein [Burkholderia sp. Ac-20365]MBN3767071.1 flagellar biosynthesis protein FlhB [Burkholderia sp. Ac-20365]
MSRTSRKSAAALVYDSHGHDEAPRVVAKGYGIVADMIVQRAKEAGLYVHQSPEMVSLLMQVDLDSRIPPRLYQAVAELLAWLHRLESGAADLPPVTDVVVAASSPAPSPPSSDPASEI